MVQIHSPRPIFLCTATYKMRKSIERLVQGQEVNGPGAFAWSILSPPQINALGCALNYNFKSIFTDNTDNISGFAWEFEVQPNVLRSFERREIDMKSSPVEKK